MRFSSSALCCLVLSAITMMMPPATQAEEIGFIEDFALAKDREEALKQLIPGTEAYYYFHALHYQNTEQLDRVDDLLKQWVARHGRTNLVQVIENRQALLTYEKNPQKSLEDIRQRLGIQFNHQRELLGQIPALPSELDQSLIGHERLLNLALKDYSNTDGFEDRALDELANEKISADQRRHLLGRLTRPDLPNMVDLVVADLAYQNSGGFGSIGIHRQLLLAQLDDLREKKPDLLNQSNFVEAYISKLRPNPDVDWQHDEQAHRAYLTRLWDFVKGLEPAHNTAKANALYHLLQFEMQHGNYDRALFIEYIKLPRNVFYINPKYMEVEEHRRYPANLEQDFSGVSLLPPIFNDEPLIRAYLHQFFIKDNDYAAFAPYIQDDFLKQNFAETKIVNGLGDPEKWASMLTPQQYQELKERVDLDFEPTNPEVVAPADPVAIELHVKNVETLIVKVFEINTQNFYRNQLRPVDTDINLDGLVPNTETVHTYDDAPVRRIKRRFEFPELDHAGVYVVDFIGNGKSSRALIRKGQLRYISETVADGQQITVLDQADNQVENAKIWLGGREFTSGKDGKILIPFSNQPGRQPIVITAGQLNSFDYLQHQSETYQFTAGIYVDRESLLRANKAKLVVRPGLSLNGTPVSLSLLEDVKLHIRSTNHEGIASTQTVHDFKLFEDRESIHEFRVPERMSSIAFQVTATIKVVSQNDKKQPVAAGREFSINQIDKAIQTDDLHFVYANGEFFVDLLGKTGEYEADRAIALVIKHRDFRRTVDVSLRTDETGRIKLGKLADISFIEATSSAGTKKHWDLPAQRHSFYQTMNALAGQSIVLPYMGSNLEATRGEFSLLETREGTFYQDHFDALSLKDGLLNIDKLPRGDYVLTLKSLGQTILLKICEGKKLDAYILGENRRLEIRGGQPLQIQEITAAEDKIRIRLNRHDDFTRVHVFATHFAPHFDAYNNLSQVRDVEPYQLSVSRSDSLYISGRKIGEEYQYILDRKYAKKFPGNMLNRPGLLLNPWAVRSTSTARQDPNAGSDFAGMDRSAPTGESRPAPPAPPLPDSQADFANLDFLTQSSAVLLNLTANEDGVIEIGRALLTGRQQFVVVAVDPLMTTTKFVTLPETDRKSRDLRLANGLDPNKHFTQQKAVTILNNGDVFTLADVSSSQFEYYDNLRDVYRLLITLNPNTKLGEFSFILDWQGKDAKEKREVYSKYACHELNFFLYKKDPEFFQATVLPYLANKLDKTYLDRWFLNQQLPDYLDPWRYAQLNVVERALLAERVDGELAQARRHLTELYQLNPTTRVELDRLFGAAVFSGSMDVDDPLGITDAKLQLGDAADDFQQFAGKAAGPGGGMRGGQRQQNGQGAMPANEPFDIANALPGAAPMEQAEKKAQQTLRQELQKEQEMKNLDQLTRDDKKGDGKGFFKRRAAGDEAAQQLYQKLDKTMEWAENNYYQLLIAQQNAELVQINQFWKDFIDRDPVQPFYSSHFAEAADNFTEMMFALSVLDLPNKPVDHLTEFEERQMKLTAKGPVIIFHEEIRNAIDERGNTAILVSQNVFRNDDRYTYDGADRLDKFVRDEFLTDVAYGCQIVVTNPTSSPQKISVLLQIPNGSLPINGSKVTNSVSMDLEPYRTQSLEYYFYFPAAGDFQHYPVHVAKNENLMAFAESSDFHVVREPSKIDRGSWAYVSQNGTDDEVVAYLQNNNLLRTDLTKIAFRMQDKAYFQKIVSLLKQHHVYDGTLWSYSIKHDLPQIINEYLVHQDGFVSQCGQYIVSKLLVIDPVARKWYEHLEYDPLVNARAHQLGRERKILNDRFAQQYNRLLNILSCHRELNDDELMATTYYMLLQDRIDEAMNFFERVSPDKLATKLQYDYFSAYLDMFDADPARARQLASKYANYPVDRWQKLFAAVGAQITEIDGAKPQIVDDQNRDQKQSQLAAQTASFDFKVDAKKVNLNFQNLKTVTVNYYVMDVELLFSRNPFVQEYSGELAFVKPKFTSTIELPAEGNAHVWDLPVELHKSNVLVEITGAGLTKSQAYYAHALNVQMVESFGQVSVAHADTGQRIPKTYVKVYARMHDGAIRFYKDGYTDLRGRFDYTSLSTNDLDFVDRFSVLILSDENGAVVKEALPPKQ